MCDCLLALGSATESGRALFAKNSDRPPDEPQRIEWMPPRRDDGPVRTTYIEVDAAAGDTVGALVSRPAWMWGVEHGVNEAGVAIGNATIYTTLDPRDAPPALTGMDLVRLGLERATSAADALAVLIGLLERYGQGGSGHEDADHPYWSSFLIADADDGWVLETSGRTWATEQVSRTRATSNRTTIFEFDAAHRHPRQPVETLVDPRLRASNKTLADEPVGVPELQAHLRSHTGEDGYSVCMHAADQATTASIIVELPQGSRRPIAHVGMGSPCSSLFVPLYVGRDVGTPIAWERFAALAPSHRRALASLEQELGEMVADNDAWADEAWRCVDEALKTLGVP